MLRRFVPTCLVVPILAVLLSPQPAGASTGALRVDPRTGVASWSSTVTCDAGDEVEIDVFIVQGSSEAHVDTSFICPESREQVVSASTNLDPDADQADDRLHPGQADVLFVRTDYSFDEAGELADVQSSESRSPVNVRPISR